MPLQQYLQESEIESQVINALGSHYFNPAEVCQLLQDKIQELNANGQNAGSFIALLNILPGITEEAKKRYE